MLAVDYDASDPAPESKTQAMDYTESVRAPVWSDNCLVCRKENLEKRSSYYVRAGSLSANQDVKLYDVGVLYFITQAAASNAIGELYAEYTIQLMTPQIGSIGAGLAIGGLFTGTSNASPFATSSGNLPATVVSTGTTTSSSTWTFTQPWQGIVTVPVTGTVLVSATGTTGTCTAVELADVVTGAATTACFAYSVVALPAQTFVLVISNTTITASSAYFAQFDV
jgi:hypothetical protein